MLSALPPSWFIPTSNDTRVRVEALWKIMPSVRPAHSACGARAFCAALSATPRASRPSSSAAREIARAQDNRALRGRREARAAVLHDHSQERKSIRGQATRLGRVHPAGASSESLDDALAAALARHLTPAELCDITCALLYRRLAVPVAVWVPRDGGLALCAQRGHDWIVERRARVEPSRVRRAARRDGIGGAAGRRARRRGARRRRCGAPRRCSATRSAASRPRRASRPAGAGSGRPSRGSPRRASTARC